MFISQSDTFPKIHVKRKITADKNLRNVLETRFSSTIAQNVGVASEPNK